jgi:hypothetical protein
MNPSPPIKCNGNEYISFGELSVEDVLKELHQVDVQLWQRYDFRTKFTIHQHTHTLPIYWLNNTWKHNTMHGDIYRITECHLLSHWVDYFYKHLLRNGIEEGIVVKAMFAKLLPKKSISSHIDRAEALQYAHRYHWIISSNESVQFMINNKSMHWSTNQTYELNNVLLHGVDNPSDSERIHFIMDVMPHKYLSSGVTYHDITPDEYQAMKSKLY